MRRGQLLGHIVVFVIGLIVVGGVLLFGMTVLNSIDEDRCEVARVTFATQLSTFIDRNRGWGTNKIVTLDAPCNTEQVCFVDRRIKDDVLSGGIPNLEWDIAPSPAVIGVIDAATKSLDPTNVFTVQTGGIVLPVERFSGVSAPIHVTSEGSTEPKLTCIRVVDETVELRMEGTGSVVRISRG